MKISRQSCDVIRRLLLLSLVCSPTSLACVIDCMFACLFAHFLLLPRHTWDFTSLLPSSLGLVHFHSPSYLCSCKRRPRLGWFFAWVSDPFNQETDKPTTGYWRVLSPLCAVSEDHDRPVVHTQLCDMSCVERNTSTQDPR